LQDIEDNAKVLGVRITCHAFVFVANIPCKSHGPRSNTFRTLFALCTCWHWSTLRKTV